MKFEWHGLVSYDEALEIQRLAHARVLAGGEDVVLGFEHPSVITLGVRGDASEDVRSKTLPVVKTDRGGQATLHSPGQLVIYPIVNLKRASLGVRDFVLGLLEVTTDVLRAHGIEAFVGDDRTGVFAPNGKIAFCGLRIEQGISRHGIAVNVSNEIALFQHIRPCGFSQEKIVSMKEFAEPPMLRDLFDQWAREFDLGDNRRTASWVGNGPLLPHFS